MPGFTREAAQEIHGRLDVCGIVREQVHLDELPQVNGVQDEAGKPVVVPDELRQELHDVGGQGVVVLAVQDHHRQHLVDHVEMLRGEKVCPVEWRNSTTLRHDADDGDSSEVPDGIAAADPLYLYRETSQGLLGDPLVGERVRRQADRAESFGAESAISAEWDRMDAKLGDGQTIHSHQLFSGLEVADDKVMATGRLLSC